MSDPPGEIFVDWCPVPDKLMLVEKQKKVVEVSWVEDGPVHYVAKGVPIDSIIHVDHVEMKPVMFVEKMTSDCYRRLRTRNYGWHERSRTVFITDEVRQEQYDYDAAYRKHEAEREARCALLVNVLFGR